MSTNTILASAPLTATGYHLKATGTALGQSLIWDNGTNVGIGNTNTSYTLDVSGSGRYNGSYAGHLLNVQNTNASYYSSTDYYDNAGTEKLIVGYGNASTGNALASKAIIYGTSGVGLNFYTNGSTTAKMVIDTSGNVGIGTVTPNYPLTIKCDTSANGINIVGRSSGDSTLSFYAANGTTPYVDWSVGTTYVQWDARNSQDYKWYCNSSLKMTLTSGGNVGIGNTGSSTYKLLVTGNTTDGSTFSFYAFNSANVDLFGIRTDGAIYTGAAGNSPYNLTTPSAANCFINTNGYLYRSTSSLKYKKNVQDYTKGLAEVLQLRPVSYESINEEEAGNIYAGLIAEEVHDLGLTEFVQYRTDGTPDALSYANMIALLTKAIQEQQAQIQNLQEQINILAK